MSTIYISSKGLCHPRHMCVPMKTNLKTSARFFKFCRKFWKAVFICFNLSRRLIVSEVFFIKNRFVVITEEFFLRYFLSCLPLEFFLRGFAVCSYQQPLYWQKINDGRSTMSDGIFDEMFLIVHRTFLVSYFRGCWLLDCCCFFFCSKHVDI